MRTGRGYDVISAVGDNKTNNSNAGLVEKSKIVHSKGHKVGPRTRCCLDTKAKKFFSDKLESPLHARTLPDVAMMNA